MLNSKINFSLQSEFITDKIQISYIIHFLCNGIDEIGTEHYERFQFIIFFFAHDLYTCFVVFLNTIR